MSHEIGFADAERVLAAQPFSVLVEARLSAFGQGAAEIRIALRDDLLQQFGFAHGGLVAYAADNTLTFAGGTVLGPSVVTRGLTLDYLRPARGVELVARTEVADHSRSQATCRCDVLGVDEDGAETLIALAQGTISRIDLERAGADA